MTLRFEGDAICLSGLTGTKLKCDVIGEYYPFWWSITSGGQSKNYSYPTAIVELNAATGEVYIEDTKETVLGSAGHALELKANTPHTENLKVILIEENFDCYAHLKNVIRRRWAKISIKEAEGPINRNSSGVYILNTTLDEALLRIIDIPLGNALFFFDPLRCVEYSVIENVARNRMSTVFKTGTEFFIFVFTSDWFLGRDEFVPLPTTPNESSWTKKEKETVCEADSFFGDTIWRRKILTDLPIEEKEKILIDEYKHRLHKWFRYVLPLPFNPKANQLFHLILCSNYEVGVRMTKNAYVHKTGNPKYSPDNEKAYNNFIRLHPETAGIMKQRKRPSEWLVLWKIITQHEEGICDYMCEDLKKIEPNSNKRRKALDWLYKKGYLKLATFENAWNYPLARYVLNWENLEEKLGITPQPPLKPISPELFKIGKLT
jgi:three-Cys-motif partner protein